MKFAYSFKQKGKVAVLLFLIMACTILIRVLEDKSIKNLEKSFATLYDDRLIPATDIFHISEKLYAKRGILETYIYSDKADREVVKNQLKKYNARLDTLVEKYEKTYLVSSEKNHLSELKTKLKAGIIFENKLLATDTEEKLAQQEKLLSESENLFSNTSNILNKLTEVQTSVGKELQNDSVKIISGTQFYSTLQLLLAAIIGILIVSILFASNVVNINSDKYHLN